MRLLLFVFAFCPLLVFGQHFDKKVIPFKDGNVFYADTMVLDKPGNKMTVYNDTRKSLAAFFNIPKAGIQFSSRNNGALTLEGNFDFMGYDENYKGKTFNCHVTFTLDIVLQGNLYIINLYNFKIQDYIDYARDAMPNWYDFDFKRYYSMADNEDWALNTMKNFDEKNKEILGNLKTAIFPKQ